MLAGYVRILRDPAIVPVAEFEADPRNFGSAERFLQRAIETTLSVGHHVIADRGFGQPATYAEVFAILGREGVLEPGFAAELEPMARMRNRLVHHYADIAPARVHDILGSRLDDFDRFAQQVTRYADGLTSPPR